MKYTLFALLLALVVPVPCLAQPRVTRAAAAAALNGDCLRVGNVGYQLDLNGDIAGQLMLFTGAVSNRVIIPVGSLEAPAGWVDSGPLVDVDLHEYRFIAEPKPVIRLCGQSRVLGVKVDQLPPPVKLPVGHSTRERWVRVLLAPLAILRGFGLNSRGEYDQ